MLLAEISRKCFPEETLRKRTDLFSQPDYRSSTLEPGLTIISAIITSPTGALELILSSCFYNYFSEIDSIGCITRGTGKDDVNDPNPFAS